MQLLTKNTYFWVVIALLLSIITKSPAIALCFGAVLSITFGNPAKSGTGSLAKKVLQLAIILLGFGLQIDVVLRVGYASVWITMVSIFSTMFVGYLLGKLFKVDRDLSVLLSTGTAICGGSAIAAMSPAIGASETHTAVAMAIVFLLNGLGLVIFPHVGHAFNMSQTDFGLWSALAIHDTSSVVGAASIYGMQALAVGTTVKLTRALWILPLSFAGAKLNKSESKAKFPMFLVFFLLAAVMRSYLPNFEVYFNDLAFVGKRLMVFTLFLIGAGLTMGELKKLGLKPLMMAVLLWVIVSVTSLYLILNNFIHFEMPIN
ncbi:MAG: putative sulfate exporter family transporter [Denitrovibrio sp.]|nr:MAG: putative sulfate exporter family transporter [Denitrovibrio sp.]